MPISDRLGAAALVLALAACHAQPSNTADPRAVASQASANADAPNAVECAAADATGFTNTCTVDRSTVARGLVLTLRNPDGSFHRLLVTHDGRGVTAADGAQPVSVKLAGADMIEVAIAGDRYRLPATVRKAQ